MAKGTDDEHKAAKGALDLAAVWSHGIGLLRANLQLIAVLAALFVLLPNAALQFTLPSNEDMEGPLGVIFDPGASEAIREKAALALSEMMAPFVQWAGIVVVVAHLGYAAIVALVGRERPTVGEAMLHAMRVILPLILAIILTFAAIYAALFVIQLVLSPMGPAAAAFLGSIVGVLLMLFLSARLLLTLPVMAIEHELNPIKALLRSWRLTSANPGNVFGFWMLIAVAWFVSLMLQLIVSSAFASIPGPGPTQTLIQGLFAGLFSMIWGAIFCVMGVALHTALDKPSPTKNTLDPE
ncbi:MAG: hypothetical protein AAF291_00120 [Pseudomonadota bacterium]